MPDTTAEEALDDGPVRVSLADSLSGWPKFLFRFRVVLLTFAIRLRLPVGMTIGLFREVAPLLEDATHVPDMVKFEPEGITRSLDIPYGTEREMTLDAFRPETATAALPAVVWVHGGGWIGGTKNDMRSYLTTLASHGFATFGVDYSWAPERHYPDQIGQAGQALAWVRDNAVRFGVDPHRLVLAGDSAGAHIIAQLARAITDAEYAARAHISVPDFASADLRGVVLTSGPFRLTKMSASTGLGRIGDLMLRAYTGHRDYMSVPLFRAASLVDDMDASFPPTFITAGNADPMITDSRDLGERLSALSVPVDTVFYPDDHEPALPHGFCCDLRRPEAREVMELMVAFVRRHTELKAMPMSTIVQ